MNYVIIGNSAAAVGCIEGIRQADKAGSITVVTDEPHHTYSRRRGADEIPPRRFL